MSSNGAARRPYDAGALRGPQRAAQSALRRPQDDDNALADRISFVLGHPVVAHRMGAAARQQALRNFHLRQMVEKTLSVYESALTPRAIPARV